MSLNNLIKRIKNEKTKAKRIALVLVRNAIQQIAEKENFTVTTLTHTDNILCLKTWKDHSFIVNDEIKQLWKTFCQEFGNLDTGMWFSPKEGWNKTLVQLV